jgi:hypothetical protein
MSKRQSATLASLINYRARYTAWYRTREIPGNNPEPKPQDYGLKTPTDLVMAEREREQIAKQLDHRPF